MHFVAQLNQLVAEAFAQCQYDTQYAVVAVSNRPDLCQFTCNGAMALAKTYRKSPLSIATEVAAALSEKPIFSKVDAVAPGFINMTVTNDYLEQLFSDKLTIKDFIDPISNEKIVLDYGGPNVAKPLHVGHLRSAIIGESLKRIARALGYTVYGDVHLGDWGLPMGLVITEIQSRYPDLCYFQSNYAPSENDVCPISIEELNEIYPIASQKSKEDEDFKKRAQEATKRLQNFDPGTYELWKKMIGLSISDMKIIYEKLAVDFDYWYGESTCSNYIEPLVESLRNQQLAYESQGALVVDVALETDKVEMPPIIIQKSDGSQLYGTTDLATILQRKDEFNPDQILYVVDNRQSLHFTQVFRCAKKAHLVEDSVRLEFIGFGTMNGADGKPYKTRDGGVMKLSDLLEIVSAAAFEKVNANIAEEIPSEEKVAIATKVGIAALKFGDLYNHRSRDYVFDVDRFVSFEGKTGPYLLYCIARINSILRKTGIPTTKKIKIYSGTETDLLLKILMTEEVLIGAFNEKAPNYLCEHVYEIATLFNKFYNENKIVIEQDQEKKNAWLTLLLLVKDALTYLLDLLAIDTVDKM